MIPSYIRVKLYVEEICLAIIGYKLTKIRNLVKKNRAYPGADLLDFPEDVVSVKSHGSTMYWGVGDVFIIFDHSDGASWSRSALGASSAEFVFTRPNGTDFSLFFGDNHAGAIEIVRPGQLCSKFIGDVLTSANYDLEKFAETIGEAKHGHTIGAALISGRFADVCYRAVSDALYFAKISPLTQPSDLTAEEIRRIFYNLRRIIWDLYNTYRGQISIYNYDVKHEYTFSIYGRSRDHFDNPTKNYNTRGVIIKWVPAIQILK